MFGIQAISDTCDMKYYCLNSFDTCWPQELPMEHMVVLQSNKNTWVIKIHGKNKKNANTVPSNAVEAT